MRVAGIQQRRRRRGPQTRYVLNSIRLCGAQTMVLCAGANCIEFTPTLLPGMAISQNQKGDRAAAETPCMRSCTKSCSAMHIIGQRGLIASIKATS